VVVRFQAKSRLWASGAVFGAPVSAPGAPPARRYGPVPGAEGAGRTRHNRDVAVENPVRTPQRTTEDREHDDRPWQVIVLNDNHNTFEGVAFALSHTLPGVSYERGLALADRIHRSGRAVVWSGVRELAEHYHDQLGGFGLTMAPLEQV
jgi:ATP-dependent Clp protease adaptor protein ClpS